MKDSEVTLVETKNSVGAKSPKVLVQLKDMYTSGFSAHSPTRPLLHARTMQALYGLSFIVYFVVVVSDWIYLYFLLRGYIATFPLKTWTAVAFVSCVVIGTMLICLLVVLCIENAFAQANDVTEFSNGCAVINEAFTQWLQAFNNFRISFLFMVFRDIPVTVLTFFYISPCRCAGPQVKHWPMALICSTTLASVYWRLVLLYFAYRRMICPLKKSNSALSSLPNRSFFGHLKSNFDKNNARLDEYDECWPVRFAFNVLYKTPSSKVHCNGEVIPRRNSTPKTTKGRATLILRKLRKWLKELLRLVVCLLLTIILYIFFLLTLCFPCCYHYGFRPKSSTNRHKCAQSFVMYFSRFFHCTMFTASLAAVLSLIFFNATLLFSAHAIGNNPIPYEINNLCVKLNASSQTITARFDDKSLEHLSNQTITYRCKPIWDDGGFELGYKRKQAGPWQTRVELSDQQLLVISTMISMNYSDRDSPRHSLYYDFALLRRATPPSDSYSDLFSHLSADSFICYKGSFSNWTFTDEITLPGWPYFEACENTWTLRREILIRCLESKTRTFLYL